MASVAEGIGNVVASHYNKLEEKGLEHRKESRIFYMRNFNNWVKSILITEARKRLDLDRPINVFDLGCGKGGDFQKWDKSRVGKIVMSDIAKTSLDQCQERFRSRTRNYTAEFILADATKDNIKEMLKDKDMQFDLVSSQFVLHYSFESLQQANRYLENVASNLRPGGYFIGTTTDSYEIMRRLREANKEKTSETRDEESKTEKDAKNETRDEEEKSEEDAESETKNEQEKTEKNAESETRNKEEKAENGGESEASGKRKRGDDTEEIAKKPKFESEDGSDYNNRKFGNAVYSVEFEPTTQLSPPELFGTKYNFHLEGVVDCPEFLVHFPTLERLAEKHNLKLIMKSRFEDYINQNLYKHQDLLSVINCLEVYPNEKLVGDPETDYNHVKDPKYEGRKVGTLSKDEWEAMTLYCVFMFQKEGTH